jgi:hypothetical protein
MRASDLLALWVIASGGIEATQIPLLANLRVDDGGEAPNRQSFLEGEFRDFAEETIKHFHTPGVSVGVVKGNETFSAVWKNPRQDRLKS